MGVSTKELLANPSETKMSAAIKNLRPVWIVGPEDIVIDHASGWAYVSSQARPPGSGALSNGQQGAIFGLNLEQERPQPINLTDELFASQFASPSGGPTEAKSDEGRASNHAPLPLVRPRGAFHPSGMSLFAAVGASRLFVINRRSSTCRTVEVFDVHQGELTHLRTIQGERHLISPNDLIAISVEQFYVTNDHGFSHSLLQNIETLLPNLPLFRYGSIAYFDGQRFTTVARDLSMPNGIAVDQTAGRLYLAAAGDRRLRYADWNKDQPANDLLFDGEIPINGAPDNLEWDVTGNLWVGVQLDMTILAGYLVGLLPISPSGVVRVSDFQLKVPRVEEIWRDDGNQLSSSSVAGVYQRADGRTLLLIGAAFDDHLLMGELSSSKQP